jgi:hypothetical protein
MMAFALPIGAWLTISIAMRRPQLTRRVLDLIAVFLIAGCVLQYTLQHVTLH